MHILTLLLSVVFLVSSVNASPGKEVNSAAADSPAHGGHAMTTAFAEVRRLIRAWAGDPLHGDAGHPSCISALLAYLDNHAQGESWEKGWRYRKDILLDYRNYGTAGKDSPLRRCDRTKDAVSQVVCTGKGIMVYHMLRGVTGDEVFFTALKRLTEQRENSQVSWDDIQATFEKSADRDLTWFFSQWLDRSGIPEFEISEQGVSVVNGVRTVTFDIIQQNDVYRIPLSVTVRTVKGDVTQTLWIERVKERYEIPVTAAVREIIVDGAYDVMRKLSHDESPPLIAGLLGEDTKLLILPANGGETYDGLIDALKDAGYVARQDAEIRDEDIRSYSLFVVGRDNLVVKRLFGSIGAPAVGFSLTVRKNPLNPSKVIAVAHTDAEEHVPSPGAFAAVARYSRVSFLYGQNTGKTADEAERGIVATISKPVLTVHPAQLTLLEDDLGNIVDKSIIYVGERHMNYEDHKTQLEIIMNLYERGRMFAIGMEMFQRPFQREIDDYLAGALNEREFLKRTQYFKRWKFDYNLYREIIEYARAKKIPVVALNLRTEIVKKVSADGLDSLSDIERVELPDSMDMSDESYRRRLMEVFRQHKGHESKNFENFYQSQILWDETMAHAVDQFLRENPGYQMIVLAGAGHLMYGSGIPKRVYRLNNKDYVIILPAAEFADREIGDYLALTEPLALPATVKLGVVLKDREGPVEIEKVIPGSIAKSAGLKKGDILVSLDDWRIEDIDDVNIVMFAKKRGEQLTIKALRKRFLFGYREVVLNTTI